MPDDIMARLQARLGTRFKPVTEFEQTMRAGGPAAAGMGAPRPAFAGPAPAAPPTAQPGARPPVPPMPAGYLETMRRQAGRDISDEEIRQVWVDQWNRAHPAPPGAPEPAPPWMAPAGAAYWPYYQAAVWGMGGMGVPAAPAMPRLPPSVARAPAPARPAAPRVPPRRPWVFLEPDTVYTVPLSLLRCLPDCRLELR